jgi:hypothetical protein
MEEAESRIRISIKAPRKRAKLMQFSQKIRKEYTFKNCDQPMTSQGHTQYCGQRYCPKDNPLSKTEWLEEK